jgi:hypothetical protein
MKRNPHPARGSRVTALGVSATAFVSIVTSLAWNTHQAEAAVNVTNPNVVPVGQTTPVLGTPTAVVSPVAPAATIAPTAPAAPTKTSSPSKPAATVAPATPVAPAAPTTPKPVAVAPAKPVATVVYTCMSPGGTTQNPTSSGQCRSGYSLTKI